MIATIERVPTPALWMINRRQMDRVADKMESMDASGLIYGWDWPTANVLHPELTQPYYRSRDELRRRKRASGLTAAEFCEREIYAAGVSRE